MSDSIAITSGKGGVGKTTIARILSKSLNCETGLDSKPCHKCSTCESISDGSFMDFQEIDAASSRGVDDTKQLLETVMHMPSSSRYKVFKTEKKICYFRLNKLFIYTYIHYE